MIAYSKNNFLHFDHLSRSERFAKGVKLNYTLGIEWYYIVSGDDLHPM
jgi:hypothetical protein